MAQRDSRDKLEMVGEFAVIGKSGYQEPIIALITNFTDTNLIRQSHDPDTGNSIARPLFAPVIEEMPLTEAIAKVRISLESCRQTIENENSDQGDKAVARNRQPTLQNTLKALKKLDGPL